MEAIPQLERPAEAVRMRPDGVLVLFYQRNVFLLCVFLLNVFVYCFCWLFMFFNVVLLVFVLAFVGGLSGF